MSNAQRKHLLLATLSVLAVLIGYGKLGDALSLEYLASQETLLRDYQHHHPQVIYILALLLYVTVTGLSIPGATVLSLFYGWFFGWLPAVILVSFASTAGATVAFLLSRTLFRAALQEKFGERLHQFNEALEKEGPLYLFTLRLIPAIPFFVINVVMGLTPLKTPTFWWVSQLGMLPATIVYIYAGASVPTLAKLAEQGTAGVLSFRILIALAMLGLFPWFARWLLAKLK